MSLEFPQDQFGNALRVPTIVLVDLCRRHLTEGASFSRATAAGILVGCRAVLSHARRCGVPVMFVRDACAEEETVIAGARRSWIKGFEPKRHESVFERVGPSCYGSPYFEEVVRGTGRGIVVAGFVGRGGCLATAADAILMGHAVTFLIDSIFDDLSARVFNFPLASSLPALAKYNIDARLTRHWIAER